MPKAKTSQKQTSHPHEGCPECDMNEIRKEFKVKGEMAVKKVKELIKEGNARKIIIKNEKGKSLMEIPVTVGAVGVVIAPILAAVGVLAAFLTECTIEVVKRK